MLVFKNKTLLAFSFLNCPWNTIQAQPPGERYWKQTTAEFPPSLSTGHQEQRYTNFAPSKLRACVDLPCSPFDVSFHMCSICKIKSHPGSTACS